MNLSGLGDRQRRQASSEWFHALANHDCGEIARRCSPENLSRLQDHVSHCLVGSPLPSDLTPEQFAEVVLDLRANELDWERAWLAAAVKADDLMLAGQTEEAVHALNMFAQDCPWQVFREAALHEVALLLGE